MSENVKNTKQFNDNGNFNFGRISGTLGKFSHFAVINNHSVINFQLSVQQNNGWYSYVPMTAWGDLAKSINKMKPRTPLHLEYSLQLSTSAITTKNGYQMYIPQVVAFKQYTPKTYATANTGKLAGNYSKFFTYKLVGKHNNVPMLRFKISSRDYQKNFNNYTFTAWGNMASTMNNNISFSDFVEVAYSLSSYKVQLKNGHSMNIPQMRVTNCRLLKSNNGKKPANKVAKPSNQSNSKDKNPNKKLDISDDDLPF